MLPISNLQSVQYMDLSQNSHLITKKLLNVKNMLRLS